MQKKKILIIRFSSIGDIVLTTPVIRCIKNQMKDVSLHYVTKEVFKDVLTHNPHIDKLHTFKSDIKEIYRELKDENFDLVIDLHKNLRSMRLRRQLKAKSYAFDKINFKKWLAVNFKMLTVLPQKHIVERYLETIEPIGVKDDGRGLDYFIGKDEEVNASDITGSSSSFVALVAGGSYHTKKIPLEKLEEICERVKLPLICLGDKNDAAVAEILLKKFPHVFNACGKYSINQSASIIKQAEWVITSDTGLMHIASAFNKRIISVWGNTIPEFGMSPYKPNENNLVLEVKNLPCRPCSKLGYAKCPIGHFKCMMEIDVSEIYVE